MTIATRRRAASLHLSRLVGGAMAAMVLGGLAVTPRAAGAQSTARGAAWSMPDPADLVQRAIRRIVTQDKPGGINVADYPHRSFGHDETVAAVRAYAGRGVTLSPDAFGMVQTWSNGRVDDALPCDSAAVPGPAVANATVTECTTPNALWVAITKIERGDLPHELHVWYATRFRSDAQGSVQSSVYSFCERWLRVGNTWKYDGFVRVAKGVVTP